MEYPRGATLHIGDWSVDPFSGRMSRGAESVRLEARTLRLLLRLAENAGNVVSIDDLLSHVWSGVIVTSDSVYQAVALLRRLLGDDPKQPTYIVTVPRLGYRLVAAVQLSSADEGTDVQQAPAVGDENHDPRIEQTPTQAPGSRSRRSIAWGLAAGLLILAGCLIAFLLLTRAAEPMPGAGTIAVLPFLDLTDSMNEEPFADGMTEELIDRLNKVPGLRVPSPTASFYFKGKQLTVSEIARHLNVAYVLDGSVRKSAATLRIAARLIRADDGYVVWSESYDRPVADKLQVQDEIAGEVTRALRGSIE